MRSSLPKVLHPLCGRPMLAFVLDAWDGAAASSASPALARRRHLAGRRGHPRRSSPIAPTFALQDEPRGTGDAVRAALAAVPETDAAELLVLSGDVPLITADDLVGRSSPPAATTTRPSPWPRSSPPTRPQLGRVVRSEFGTVERIVEAKDATEDELDGNEINAGLYAFDAEWLRRRIDTLAPSATTGELYLTELIRLAREDGRLVSAVAFEDDGRFDGINDRSQLAAAEWNLRVRRNEQHMRDGVTMRDPSTVYLDWDVRLAAGRHPGAERHPARARRRSGRGASSAPGSQLIDSTVGANARVWASVVESSTIEDEATVGPFSHLRPGSVVGRGAEVGNFAELKNTRLGRGQQAAPHELPRRRRDRRAGQHRRRHDHRQLRRLEEAPHDDRRRRVHRRRHDDRRAARHRRGRQDRRRLGRHQGRAGGQARGRRPGPDPRAAAAREPEPRPRPTTARAAVGTRRGRRPS